MLQRRREAVKERGSLLGSHLGDYCTAPRWGLTTRCHEYTMGDNSDEDTSSRVEMGNTQLIVRRMEVPQ